MLCAVTLSAFSQNIFNKKEKMVNKTDINKFTKLPMEDFFRNPEKSSFNISPDGLRIAYMKPWEEGNRMMNIYVKSIDSDEELRLTKASERSIYGFFWISDERIAYVQDKGGDDKSQVWEKVLEEIEELKVEIKNGDNDRIESEFGDVLFALTNYARFIDVNPEDALERTNKRFIKRFQIMEKMITKEGLDLSEMKLSEMDVFWEKAKEKYYVSKDLG